MDEKEWQWNNGRVNMYTDSLNLEELLQHQTDEGWQGFPEGSVIGHIHLKVHDLNVVREFYCDLLNFDVVAEYGPQALFISDKGYHHHIGLNIWQSAGGQKKLEKEVGLNWYSIKMTEDERQDIKKKLEQKGYLIEELKGSFVVEDPAGIKIYF
ncbi:VOC family protein [Bacillaceae bacterium W0354]